MRLEQRDYKKHPLTEAEIRQTCADGKRWAKKRLAELVSITEDAKRNPPKGGPRY